ncbi:MAG: plasmid pRiA4b ORF-3 family protein [Alphaproteobacteria bacterium]|nr:plasmid pRiA4b ORF-3 family protein [Alphaproteobacteria bacterium]
MTATAIAHLKIVLDDVQPQVLRRIEVPLAIRLDLLHLALQAALGWTNSHLYEIRARDVAWGMTNPGWNDGPLDARKTRLIDVLEDVGVKTFRYLYDFGDSWDHLIKIERIGPAVPGIAYPRLIEAIGLCPPEDIGGPPGYDELLAAKADPAHERRDEFAEWIDLDAFDPNAADFEARARAVNALAKKWARKPAVKRKHTR